jgi:hypothetical protein
MICAKSEVQAIVKGGASNPIERHLAKLLEKGRVLAEELRMRLHEVCPQDLRNMTSFRI